MDIGWVGMFAGWVMDYEGEVYGYGRFLVCWEGFVIGLCVCL